MGLGDAVAAEKSYLEALEILQKAIRAHFNWKSEDKFDFSKIDKEDLESLNQIYYNSYLAAITADMKERAKFYNNEAMHCNKILHGERSIEYANNQFL